MISGENCSEVSEKFEDFTILYMYIAHGQDQINSQNFVDSYTSLIKHCKFQPLVFIHIEKMIFQHFPHTNIWWCKFDLTVNKIKCLPKTNHLNKFVDIKAFLVLIKKTRLFKYIENHHQKLKVFR